MIQVIPPKSKVCKSIKYPIYWKIVIKIPNFNNLECKIHSLQELSNVTGVNQSTLQKILYDKNYNSKKYKEALQMIKIEPVYELD